MGRCPKPRRYSGMNPEYLAKGIWKVYASKSAYTFYTNTVTGNDSNTITPGTMYLRG
jgi:hypothetical protein